ncbi:nuclease A inhibitor family protein [Flaviaesturariibacter amylovorans]|uniref:Nuclease A inhibitor family protein n=1 Tax=Flaviaesturariibacter amylovorans TaxID=1084520 RepID=A0ABP8HCN7_9BACT
MHPELLRLQEAAQGLLYLSETDAPLLAFELDGTGVAPEAALPALSDAPAGTPPERVELTHFFRNQVRAEEGGGPELSHRAGRFRSLQQQLEKTLAGVAVYRLGSVQVDAFILGRLPDGTVGGLRTKLVET